MALQFLGLLVRIGLCPKGLHRLFQRARIIIALDLLYHRRPCTPLLANFLLNPLVLARLGSTLVIVQNMSRRIWSFFPEENLSNAPFTLFSEKPYSPQSMSSTFWRSGGFHTRR